MAIVYKDMINSLAWNSYDIIQDLIGYYYLHNANIDKIKFIKNDYGITFNLPYLEIEDGKRAITLEEFKRYTIELYKPAIYDNCTVIETVLEFYSWGPIEKDIYKDIDTEVVKSIDKDNLYNFISNLFDWIYENNPCFNKHKMMEKIIELENKHCSNISVIAKGKNND